ncbi:MAG: tRNA modification GTPase MnmE [Syntrophorhabdaceae bacterium PtaU1.Bin034]|nr:MAG: tRNA modification GTPase MnmE [Syntrophorhabdaceae bacterium PtaU1.Bin034]
MRDADTICAVSSPIGEGGIGIIRMSGPAAHSILKKIFRPRKPVRSFVSHRLYLGFVFDPQTNLDVDEVFAVLLKKPRTYTRESMSEVYAHGGLAAQNQILMLMVRNGARIAEPGEFTQRAFLNGRIDLAQAESILDVIKSETDNELRHAVANMKGMLSEKIEAIRQEIRGLIVEVEAGIDFPEEELDIQSEGWISRLTKVRTDLNQLISSYYEGRAIRDGLEVLIVGRTNVGKSSLLNALLLKEKAIVTSIPGTTRDLVEDTIHIKGIKFRITDTAGLRRSDDPIEKEGIDRVRKRIPEADVILWVLDASEPYRQDDEETYEAIRDKRTIAVFNKTDLPERLDRETVISRGVEGVEVSALTGSGLENLKNSLHEVFLEAGSRNSGALVTNARHKDALARTGQAIGRAENCSKSGEPVEFLAFELRDALSCLGEITGETCTEEILSDIFSRFCIGK